MCSVRDEGVGAAAPTWDIGMETGSSHRPTLLFVNKKLASDDEFEVYRKIDEALRGRGVWVLGFFSSVDHISKGGHVFSMLLGEYGPFISLSVDLLESLSATSSCFRRA
jgi:hypothetical protein